MNQNKIKLKIDEVEIDRIGQRIGWDGSTNDNLKCFFCFFQFIVLFFLGLSGFGLEPWAIVGGSRIVTFSS